MAKKSIDFKKIFIVLGAGLAVLVPLRLYHLFFLTEEDKSGFFTNVNASVYIFYSLLALFAIVLYALVSVTDKVTASKSVRGKSKSLTIGAGLFALGLAYDVAVSSSTFIKSFLSYSSGINLMTYLFSNGMFAVALEAVCGLFACIYFILFALSYSDGKTTYYDYKFLAIMPLFWSMFRMVHRFMTKISFSMVADLLIELFTLAFMMLFFMSFARISSQICQKNEMRKAMKYGVVAAFGALLLGITRLAVTVCGKSNLLAAEFDFIPADLFFGIFAVLYIDACSKTGRDASEDDLLPDAYEEPANEIDDDFLGE